MPRDYSSVNVTIWADPDWREIPPAAQHLYLMLWTSPSLSYCGIHDWRPRRLTGFAAGFTGEHIEMVAAHLQARHFLVVDDDTEEVLIRSWARFDGLLKKPRMAVSFAKAYSSAASPTLRAVLAREVHKIHDENPALPCWQDRRVAQILDHPTLDAKDLHVPEDPFAGDFEGGLWIGLPQTVGSVCGSPTPSPTPTPTPDKKDSPPASRGSRISGDFAMTDEMRQWALGKGYAHLNLDGLTEDFVDYWVALPGPKALKLDWVATWRGWINRKAGDAPRSNVRAIRDPRLGEAYR